MKKVSAAGFGAIAFVVLTIVGMLIENGPGGNYNVSDVQKYLTHGHRTAIFVATYMVLLGVVGLVLLLARFRDAIPEGSRRTVFWSLSIAGIGAWVAGWGIGVSVPVAEAYGGSGVTVAPTVTYILNDAGFFVLAAGATLIGLALLTFVLGSVTVPAWTRWFTLVGAVGAVAAPAFFPFALFFIWALVTGGWLVATERESVPSAQTVSA